MKQQSHTVNGRRQPDSLAQRHLPLVDILHTATRSSSNIASSTNIAASAMSSVVQGVRSSPCTKSQKARSSPRRGTTSPLQRDHDRAGRPRLAFVSAAFRPCVLHDERLFEVASDLLLYPVLRQATIDGK